MDEKTMGSRASTVIMAALYLALGIMMLVFPQQMSGTIMLILGVIALLIGIVKLIICFAASKGVPLRVADFIVGVVFVVLGVATLILREKLLNVIPVIFGLFLLISSLLKIRDAIDARRFSSSRWVFSLVVAVISAVMALILILRPAFVMELYFRLIGIFLIIDGASGLMSALSLAGTYHGYKKTMKRSVYDTDSYTVEEADDEEE